MANYKLIDFKILGDQRGSLIAIEQGYNTPFEIKRVYYIFDTIKGVERGFHAHIDLKQIAIVVKGSCTFILDVAIKRIEQFTMYIVKIFTNYDTLFIFSRENNINNMFINIIP